MQRWNEDPVCNGIEESELLEMSIMNQQTLKKSIRFSGIGLHSGQLISVRLCPAPPETGVVFRVKGTNGHYTEIPARYQYIGALNYNTSLKAFGEQIQTVEHLLSALHGFGIDNAYVELDQGEIPVMDGSAAPFVYLISEAGCLDQAVPRHYIRLTSPVRIDCKDAWIEATPVKEPRLSVEYSIEFDHPCIGSMTYRFDGDSRQYAYQIAPARTFGFMKEVEFLRRQGLIKGASFENAVVMDDFRVISGALRFRNEFVRHKVLDFWGDIVLLGKPLAASIKAHKAGHRVHSLLVEKLLTTPGLVEPLQPVTEYENLSVLPALAHL